MTSTDTATPTAHGPRARAEDHRNTAEEERALHEHPIVRVVACGSVDDGKSTLIGRLLAETESVPDRWKIWPMFTRSD